MAKSKVKKLTKKELEEVKDKYGSVNISLEDGTISPVEEKEEVAA